MKYLRLLNVIIFTSLSTFKIESKQIDYSFYFFIFFLLLNTAMVAHDLYEVSE